MLHMHKNFGLSFMCVTVSNPMMATRSNITNALHKQVARALGHVGEGSMDVGHIFRY